MNYVDEDSKSLAAENLLKSFGNFVDSYGETLAKLLSNDDDDEWSRRRDVGSVLEIDSEPRERISFVALLESDDKSLSKVVLVLASVCSEMDFLVSEAETKFYNQLALYGSHLDGDEYGKNDEESVLLVSRMLPVLQDVASFADYADEVILNAIQQVAALYYPSETIIGGKVHLSPLFERLSRLLVVLVTLDEIISASASENNLRDHWTTYKRMVKAAQLDPSKYGLGLEGQPSKKLKQLERTLDQIESKVLTASFFKNAIQQAFDKNGMAEIMKNGVFRDEFWFYVRNALPEAITEVRENVDINQRLKLVGISALVVLHNSLFQTLDKKFMSRLIEAYKKVPGVVLHGKIMWFPEQFMKAYVSGGFKSTSAQSLASNRRSLVINKNQTISADTKRITSQVSSWVIQMEGSLRRNMSNLSLDELQRKSSLLLSGLKLAISINNSMATLLALHHKLRIPFTKIGVINICKTLELLKAIENTFSRHSLVIGDLLSHICQFLSFQQLTVLAKAKRGVTADKKYTKSRLDILSSLVLAENVISGPVTEQRRLLASLLLSIAAQNKTFKDDEMIQISTCFRRLNALSQLQKCVGEVTRTDFFYWHRALLNTYFTHIYENHEEAHHLHYIFAVIEDSSAYLEKVVHLSSPSSAAVYNFEKEILEFFEKSILDPLCRDLETDLRLQAHSHLLQLEDRNPFKARLNDKSAFLKVAPVKFFQKRIDIKAHVVSYLEKIFYNLTTVALHDWRTYGEMRALSAHKFGLETLDDHLPPQTLEQGVDVLEIMRNIHLFVAQYYYNLNNQIFVEQSSKNKHLNTVGINHVANSIRTHGTGIMNTTVNFTYQFLRKQFVLFSQFLFDDHIKSRLIKDVRFFRENRTNLDQKYPYERADKFNRGIRKLGVNLKDGSTYLDRFRILISQIGNGMGFVRMIRSGGLHCVSNAIRFIPDLDDIPNFETLAKEENLSEESVEAAKILDSVAHNLNKDFSERNEYFRLLVSVFASQFNEKKHDHLKNFYVTIPPLTVNFVEHLISAKEKMTRKNKDGAAFTDDGFAMGIAYVLRLLDQWSDFDSLHWFQSVSERYQKERDDIEKQQKGETDDKLLQTLALSLKRINTYQKEFELLHYNLSSARIFFRKDTQNHA